MENANKTVIFLHIPRTAGTTLHRIIERHYPSSQIFSTGLLAQESMEKFKSFSESTRARLRMVKGHMAFGLHEHIPGASTYFTLLREPVERVISFYSLIRNEPKHYLHKFVTADNKSLYEFLKDAKAASFADNTQTRMISGFWMGPECGKCSKDMLEKAKKNLRERFSVVGLTEKFDETLLLLKSAFGWNKLFYEKQNVSSGKTDKSSLLAEARELIKKLNQYDMELYEYAVSLFNEQAARQGPSFVDKVREFKTQNKPYNPLLNAYWRLRSHSVGDLLKKIFRM